MMLGKKLAVITPACNVEKTLEKTYSEIPHKYVDGIILIDDEGGY